MKKTITIILAISILAILTLSLSGCLMVSLQENSLREKFNENGFTTMLNHSILSFSDERMQGLHINKCYYAFKEDETVYEQHNGLPSQKWEVCVYYMEDSASASALVKVFEGIADEYNQKYDDILAKLESNTIDETVTEYPKKYLVYRYNDIVVFGDWQSVSMVRGY